VVDEGKTVFAQTLKFLDHVGQLTIKDFGPRQLSGGGNKLCEEIFEEKLAGWYEDASTWPRNRSYEVFCHWFDYRHHSMLVDLCDEPLIYD
jgi:hypothetical protein